MRKHLFAQQQQLSACLGRVSRGKLSQHMKGLQLRYADCGILGHCTSFVPVPQKRLQLRITAVYFFMDSLLQSAGCIQGLEFCFMWYPVSVDDTSHV
jgi:hypothetical protein